MLKYAQEVEYGIIYQKDMHPTKRFTDFLDLVASRRFPLWPYTL